MIPQIDENVFDTPEPPGATWLLFDLPNASPLPDARRVPEGLDSMAQEVFLALNTERFINPIFSWNYGAEWADLPGKPLSFVKPELERRVREALSRNGKITAVDGFRFENDRKNLRCTFTVHSVYGCFDAEKEVI